MGSPQHVRDVPFASNLTLHPDGRGFSGFVAQHIGRGPLALFGLGVWSHDGVGALLEEAEKKAAVKALVYRGPFWEGWKDVADRVIREEGDAIARVEA